MADSKDKKRLRVVSASGKSETGPAQNGNAPRNVNSAPRVAACWINRDWQRDGFAAIHVLVTDREGGHAFAAYLVDLWCIGLKDAYGRLNITQKVFDDTLQQMRARIEMGPVDVAVARRLVAGGIQFAKRNHFRLPPRYSRWVSLLGEMDEDSPVDISDFGVDDGLRYMGTVEDLEARLMDCTLEEFLDREDVEVVWRDDGDSLCDEDEMEIEETMTVLRERGLDVIRRWCFANQEHPHPQLPEAWDATLDAILDIEFLPEEDEPGEEAVNSAEAALSRIFALQPPEKAERLAGAFDQVLRFMMQYQSAGELFEAMGFEDADEDEEG